MNMLSHGLHLLTSLLRRGCVTPKIIANLIEASEETGDGNRDYTLLDGYEDLSPEHQSKVREALEQGHVADSEWRGVRCTLLF
jgi:hypothetical protein